MRTPPYRRDDGKFGLDGETTPETKPASPIAPPKRGPGRRFQKGVPRHPKAGRQPGSGNKLKADMDALRARARSGDINLATGEGIKDELIFLEWVWQNPLHRLDLRMKAAAEAASYKYAKKHQTTHDISDELRETAARLIKGRERVAAGKKTE